MTDRNGIVTIVEELLGAEGSRETAERLTEILIEEGLVVADPPNGYRIGDELMDEYFWDLAVRAEVEAEK